MSPYRKSTVFADRSSRRHSEELIFYGLLVAIGAIPVVIASADHAAFGVEATLGLLMLGAGVIGAIFYGRRMFNDPDA
jgi:hypothetical protein